MEKLEDFFEMDKNTFIKKYIEEEYDKFKEANDNIGKLKDEEDWTSEWNNTYAPWNQ
jgi:hypothetical protein